MYGNVITSGNMKMKNGIDREKAFCAFSESSGYVSPQRLLTSIIDFIHVNLISDGSPTWIYINRQYYLDLDRYLTELIRREPGTVVLPW